MTKKIFLIFFLFCGITTHVSAIETYPEKIENFARFSKFKDVYKKIYNDMNNENETEILRRTSEHNQDILREFFEKENQFTQDELALYCGMNVPKISHDKKMTQVFQMRGSSLIKELCQTERNLLRQQNNLARKNTFRSLFSNDSLKDSPFDIIKDLRDIDNIFFGKKYREQKTDEPSFLKYEQKEDFNANQEDWQDQRKNGIGSELSNTVYNTSHADSIVGNLAGLFEAPEMPLTKLENTSLMPGIATTKFMEPAQPKGTTGNPGETSQTTKSAATDKTQPESEIAKNTKSGDDFQGLINDVLNQSKCQELGEDKEITQRETITIKELMETSNCEAERTQTLQKKLQTLKTNQEKNDQETHFGASGEEGIRNTLIRWNQNFDAFLSHAKELKTQFDIFIVKPQK